VALNDPFYDFFPTLPEDRDVWDKLDALVGPFDPDGEGAFGLRRARERDEGDLYVTDAKEAFSQAGLRRLLIPERDGGLLKKPLEEQWSAFFASRDLSCAVTFNVVSLILKPIEYGGTPEQRKHYFDRVLDGVHPAYCLTELDHGSDILSNKTRATRVIVDREGRRTPCAPDDERFTHYVLTGEKRLINTGDESDFKCVVARTGESHESGGPEVGTLSFFVVENTMPGVVQYPRYRTHGICGVNLSGFRMDDVLVPRGNLLGAEGDGFRLARRAFEVHRGTICSMAAGQLLLGFRLACRWARGRKLYGAPILQLQPVRDALLRAYVELELIFALAQKTAYVTQFAPLSARDLTCQAKMYGPLAAFQSIIDLGWVIGARGYLRENPFELLVRDSRILAIFDGTLHVQEGQVIVSVSRPRRTEDAIRDPIGVIRNYRTLCEPSRDFYRSDRGDWPLGRSEEIAALQHVLPELRLEPLVSGRKIVERIVKQKVELKGERSPLAHLIGRMTSTAALAERIAFETSVNHPVPAARRAALHIASAEVGLAALALASTIDPENQQSLVDPDEEIAIRRGAVACRQSEARAIIEEFLGRFDAPD
jgi:alkylation response protein AidB-like acyl-CoA dehydrogenase